MSLGESPLLDSLFTLVAPPSMVLPNARICVHLRHFFWWGFNLIFFYNFRSSGLRNSLAPTPSHGDGPGGPSPSLRDSSPPELIKFSLVGKPHFPLFWKLFVRSQGAVSHANNGQDFVCRRRMWFRQFSPKRQTRMQLPMVQKMEMDPNELLGLMK